MAKPRLRLVAPPTENRTVAPRRAKNGTLRTREHLTIDEVERLIEAAKHNRYGHRDALMVLLAFRHGLRPGEVVDLRWDQIEFKAAALHVRRHPSADRPRAASAAPSSARECQIALCVRVGARRATLRAGVLPHGRTGRRCRKVGNQGSCSYASPRLWLQARERRSRYPLAPGLSGTS
jgi:integrase